MTGNVLLDQTDAAFTTLGDPLVMSRSYNSLNGPRGSMGLGWTHPYEMAIFPMSYISSRMLTLREEDGALRIFAAPADPLVFRPIGVNDSMERIEKSETGFVRFFADGATQTFDSNGKLVALTDRLGRTTSLTYNGFGNLVRVEASDGRALNFTYLGSGSEALLQSVSGPAGPVATYTYSSPPLGSNIRSLLGVDYPDGRGYRFTYDSEGLLLTVADRDGIITDRHGYNNYGQALFSERSGGRERRDFVYEADKTTLTDANGGITVFEFVNTGAGRRVARRSGCGYSGGSSGIDEWEYDNQGRIIKHTDSEGAITLTEYTGPNVTKVTNALGRATTISGHDSLAGRARSPCRAWPLARSPMLRKARPRSLRMGPPPPSPT